MIEYKFISVGDIICTTIESVHNTSIGATSGVKVDVKVPYGVVYYNSNLSKGSFSGTQNSWEIGTLRKNEKVQGDICWLVTDDCYVPYDFEFTVSTTSGKACINDGLSKLCLSINALTNCIVNLYKSVKWVFEDYNLNLQDQTILVSSENDIVNIYLPNPMDVFLKDKSKGSEWDITVLDITNPVTLIAPAGVKIVDKSTIADATSTFEFTLVGQTVFLQSIGTNYIIKYAV